MHFRFSRSLRRPAGSKFAIPALRTVLVGVACFTLNPTFSHAAGPVLPTAGTFVAGNGSIVSEPDSLTVSQSSTHGVINWNSFSIGAGGKVLIDNGSGATLNRVVGNDLSKIDGQLSSSGSVYLINQNGIIIGPDGKVVTGGSFVASTRNISNGQFMQGGAMTASGTSIGAVTNEGTIVAKSGDVVIIGQAVSNSGSISSPRGTSTLAAGNDILMTQVGGPAGVYVAPGSSGSVTNSGSIKAAAAALQSAGGNVYTLAGNRTGIIQATGTSNVAGQVWLAAPQGTTSVDGTVSAKNSDGSGGSIVANGSSVSINSDANLDASGTEGGSVSVGVSSGGGDEAVSTSIATGAAITAGGSAGGGSIETSGKTFSLGSAKISAGSGGSWLLDPTDLTIDATAASTIDTALNAGTSVTEQTTASGASGAGTQASGNGDINVDSAISWTNSAANLSLLAYYGINVNASISGAGSILMSAAGSNLTIAAGVSVAGATGVTLETAGNFVNNAGASAVSSSDGRWLIYSTNPALDTDGGLAENFIQYGATSSSTGTATAADQAVGNGFLYRVTPSVSLAFDGTVSSVYNGMTVAPLTSSNVTETGLINGDSLALTGAYGTANAGSNIQVSVTGVSAYHGSPAVPVYGYAITDPTLESDVGVITPAQLTATIINDPTKIYDGTTTATLTSANYEISGFIGTDSATVNQPSSVAYAGSSAGAEAVNATFASSNFVAQGTTDLANYILPPIASGDGEITPAPLEITGLLATSKVYDQTTIDALDTSQAGIYGVINSDQVSLISTNAVGTFATANVENGIEVTASGFTLSGVQASDYEIVPPTGLVANITPASLSISGVVVSNKIYDGTTSATLNTGGAALSGVLTGDQVFLVDTGAAAAFATANAENGIMVSVGGFDLSGAQAADYTVSQPTGLTADITPASLGITLGGDPTKVYDGGTGGVLAASNFILTGFVAGQSATINQEANVAYASPDAGSENITATLVSSDYTPSAGTLLSNYILPTSVIGAGTITPAPITVALVGDPTKTYDGTTSISLSSSNFVLSGLVGDQSITISPSTGNFASANAGVESLTALLTGEYVAGTGTLLSNYSLPSITTGLGTITPAPLDAGYIDASIVNDPTKVYDGTATATLTSADYELTGFVDGQGATVTQTVGVYASTNAGSEPITVSLSPADFTPDAGTNLANYQLPTSAYGQGTITPALLTGEIIGNPTKVYNGTTSSTLNAGNYALSGLIPGQAITINQAVNTAYASDSVGTNISITANLSAPDFSAGAGTLLSNYVLPTTATGTGQITPAPLIIANVSANSKIYDTTNLATLINTSAALNGVIGSDQVVLSTAGTTANFSQVDVGNDLAVDANGYTISGAQAFDYTLEQPTGLQADITPAPLIITGVSAADRQYDGTAADTLNVQGDALSGVLGTDSVDLDNTGATGNFTSVNVGNDLTVVASGFTISGPNAEDYSLIQPSGLTASITPRQILANINVEITGDPTKVYDGSTSVTLTASDYTLSGFVGDQGASIPQTASASYDSPNAGSDGVTADLVLSDYVAEAGTNLSNYILPAVVTGTGTITPAPISATIIGNPTKVYDANTSATLTSSSYELTGFISGQGATVSQTSGIYASPTVGTENVTAALAADDFTATGSTILSNYSLPAVAKGNGTITPATLTIAGIAANDKVYDGNAVATLNTTDATLVGLQGADAPTLISSSYEADFANDNVGTGIAVVASGFTISGTDADDYILVQPTGLEANITPATLTLGEVTKQYDSTSSLPTQASDYTLNGIYSGDSVTVDTAALTPISDFYADKNVASDIGVTAPDLTLTGPQAYDYVLAPVSDDLIGTITPAPLTISGITAESKTYDASPAAVLTGTPTLNGVFSGDTVTVNTIGTTGTFANQNVGTDIAVTATSGDYTISGAQAYDYTVSQPTGLEANITPAVLALTLTSVTKVYDGTTNAPTANTAYTLSGVYAGDTVAVDGADLTASSYASSNVESGIDVTLNNISLTGAEAADYTIASSVIDDPIGSITPATLTYDATAASQVYGNGNTGFSGTVTGFVDGQTLATATTGTAAFASTTSATTNVGSYAIDGAGLTADNGDYVFAQNAANATALSITPYTLTASLTGTVQKTYDGTDAATLGAGNYSLSDTVNGDSITLSDPTSGTYATPNVGSGIDVAVAGLTLGGANAGDYQLAASSINGDVGSITPATLTYDATAASQVYGNGNTGFSGTVTGFVDGQTLATATTGTTAFASTTSATTNVGSYAIDGAGLTADNGDYVFAQNAANATALSITPAALLYVATPTSQVYGNGNTVFNGTVTGFVDGQTLATTTTGTAVFNSATSAASNVGAYDINGSGLTLTTNDYTLSEAAANATALTITPATLTYDATAASQTYGNGNKIFAGIVTGFVDGQTLATATTGTAAFASTTSATTNIGSYAIDGSGLTADHGDYIFVQATTNGTALTITPATLTYDATAASQVYGNGNTGFSGTVTGFVDGQTLATATTGTAAFASTTSATTNVGSYAIDGAGLTADHGDYVFAQNAANATALTITPAALLYVATPTRQIYGVGNTVFNGTVTGFVDGQTLATTTTGTAVFNSATSATSNVGAYDINGSGLTLTTNDYTLSEAAANATALTITPATLTYDATAASQVYGNGNTGFSGTVTGFVDGQTLATATTGTAAFASTTSATTNVGSYAIDGAGLTADNGNYVFAQNAANATALSITPYTLTASLTGTVQKTYDGTDAATLGAGNYSLSDTVNGDSITLSDPTSGTYATPNVGSGIDVAVAGLTLGGANAGDYQLAASSINGDVGSITPATLTYDATAASQVYGNGNTGFSGTVTGFVDGQTLATATTGTAAFASTTSATTNVGSYAIDGAGLTADNGDYVFAQNAANATALSITPYTLTASLTGTVQKTYDGTDAATLGAGNYSLSDTVNGDSITLSDPTSGTYATPNVGSGIDVAVAGLTLGGANAGDYQLAASSINGDVGSITPATLTYDATAASQVYGNGNTGFSGTVTGFVDGQTLATATTGTAAFASTTSATTNVGSYAIDGAGLTADNGDYVFAQNAANATALSITPAALLYVATPTSQVYGNGNTVFNGTVIGFVDGQTLATTTTGTAVFNSATSAASNVGAYDINGSGLTLTTSDYTLSEAAANATALSITPYTLTASLTGTVQKTYDGTDAATLGAGNYSLSDTVNGDSITLSDPTSGTYATPNVGSGIDVAVAGLTLGGANAGDYQLAASSINGDVGSITPATLTYDATAASQVYGNGNTGFSGTVTGFVDGQTLATATTGTAAFASTTSATTNVGSYAIDGAGLTADNGDYVFAQNAANATALSITPYTLTASLTGTVQKTYDGTDAATLGAGNYSLSDTVNGDSITLSDPTSGTYATPNVGSGIDVAVAGLTLGGANAGDYQLAASSINGDVGSITPATLTYDATAASQVYGNGNTGFSGTVTGFVDGQTLATATTGTAAFASTTSATTNVGSYAIDGAGLTADNGDYVFAQNAANATALSITPYTLTASLTGTVQKTYDGTDAATLGAGNYSLSDTVNGDSITLSDPTSGTYATPNVGSGIDVAVAGLTLGGANAGDYQLAASSINGDVGSITPATLTYDATAASQVYGNGNTGFSGTVTGFVDGQTLATATTGTAAFASTTSATTNVGSYAIDGAGLTADNGDYVFAQNAANATALSITPYTLTASLTGTVQKTYDGTDAATLGAGNYSLSDTVNGDSITLSDPTSGTYATPNVGSGIDVAVAGLTLGGANAGDYQLAASSINGDVGSITPATLTYDATAASQVYGNGNTGFSGTVTGFVDGQTLATATTGTAAFASTTSATTNVGSYAIDGAGLTADNGDYVFAQNAANATALSITPYTLTASLTGTVQKTYDGTDAATLGAGNYSLSDTVNGDSITLSDPTSGTYATPNVGSGIDVAVAGLTLGGANAGDYQLAASSINGDVGSITPATLTYDATAASQVYGNGNTGFSGTVTGFVDGQTLATATTGTAAFASTTSATTNVGSYAIDGAGLTADNGNYVFAQNAANATALSITPYTLTASLTGTVQKTYDGTDAATLGAGNYSLSDTVNGDSITLSDPTSGTYATPNVGSGIDVAVAGLTLGGANAGDYQLAASSINGDVGSITPATLTYDATAASQVYGNGNTGFSGTVTGFVDGQTLATATTGTAAFASTTSATTNVGSYAIDGAGLTADNGDYVFAQNAANATALSITPYTLTASLTGTVQKTYDGTDAATLGAGNYSLSDTVNGDSITLSDPTSGTYATPNVGSGIDVAVAGLTLGGANAGDYQLAASSINGDVGSITPATLTIAITNNPTKVYDGTTTALLNPTDYSLTGFIGDQGASVTQANGTYESRNASSETVVVSLTAANFAANSGTELTNYILPTTASGIGTITPATLTVSGVVADDKLFDGTTADSLNFGNAELVGIVPGDSVNLSVADAKGIFSTDAVGDKILVSVSGLTIYGPDASNYILDVPFYLAANIIPATLDEAVAGNISTNVPSNIEQIIASLQAGVNPVINIPFPAPGGLLTQGGGRFGSLPTVIVNSAIENTQAGDMSMNSAGQDLIVSPEEILLQGNRDKTWRVTSSLPSLSVADFNQR